MFWDMILGFCIVANMTVLYDSVRPGRQSPAEEMMLTVSILIIIIILMIINFAVGLP